MQTLTMVAFGVVLVALLYAGSVLLFRKVQIPERKGEETAVEMK